MMIYGICNRITRQWSIGGIPPKFAATGRSGKRWSCLGDLKRHLTAVLEYENYWDAYANCDILEFSVKVERIVSTCDYREMTKPSDGRETHAR
jgi:hypothetical protein